MSYWQWVDAENKIGCREGPMNDAELFPLFEKYIAEESLICGDGLTAMASYVEKTKDTKRHILLQISHSAKGNSYSRIEEHVITPDGNDIGPISVNTCKVDGRHSHHRRFEQNDGSN